MGIKFIDEYLHAKGAHSSRFIKDILFGTTFLMIFKEMIPSYIFIWYSYFLLT